QTLTLDGPVYPLAGPGVFLSGRPNEWLTSRFGAYTGDAGDDVAGNHGFGWRLGNNAGYTFFTEIAAAAPAGALPGTYTPGGLHDTAAPRPVRSWVRRSSHYELYLMVAQALIANDQGDPVLGVFAEITGSPQDLRNVVGIYAGCGVALFGPLPSRPKDVLGLAGSVLRFTNDFQAH